MKRLKRRIRILANLWVLLRHHGTVSRCYELLDDPSSKRAVATLSNLSEEERDGVEKLNQLEIFLRMSTGTLRKEIKHLEDKFA